MARLRGVLALLVVLPITGCASAPATTLPSWTFVAPDGTEHETTLPEHVDAWLPRAPCVYHLRRTVTLDGASRGRTLTFVVPSLPARVRLVANGVDVEPLDPLWYSDYRSTGPHRFRIPAELTTRGELTLDVAVEHVWTQSAWIDSRPRLSATALGDRPARVVRALNLTLSTTAFVVALLMALSYGVMFLFGGRRGPAAWFALEAAGGASYPAFLMGITQWAFGVYDTAVMGFCMTTATYASIRFVHGHCGLGPPHWAWRVTFVAVAANAIVASGPFVATPVSGPFVMAFMAVNAFYQFAIFVRMKRERRPAHVWLVPLAWPLANVVATVDFAAWFGFGELLDGVRFGAGPGVLGIVQSVALSREFITSARRTEELNRELAARVAMLERSNDEVRLLNDELRRQIAARSDQLLLALSHATTTLQPRDVDLGPGAVIADRYRVTRRLGSGGMGVVYEAERTADGRHVALKVLALTRDTKELRRFALEARAIATLSHPHVVRVLDVDVATEGLLFLAMELLDQRSLEDRDGVAQPWPWKREVLAQVALALEAIHARGIVHRDLKPGNVLFVPGGDGEMPHVKVADFGIAVFWDALAESSLGSLSAHRVSARLAVAGAPVRAARSSLAAVHPVTAVHEKLTVTGDLLGTPLYMAPELADGAKEARPAADLFSFGVLAYELLTGRAPFDHAAIVLSLSGEHVPSPRPLSADCPELDAEQADLLTRCLAANPEERPTAATLARAFAAPRSR